MAFDNKQAHREGWQLSERSEDGLYCVERLDDPQSVAIWFGKQSQFADDHEALLFVRGEAGSGSPYHQTAAFLHGKPWYSAPFIPKSVPVHAVGDDLDVPDYLRRVPQTLIDKANRHED